MKLHIENFARISSADILFDGLTVIAGDNNTGKSTVGKVLYSFFRGQSDIVRRVNDERIKAVRDAFRNFISVDLPERTCAEILKGTKNAGEVLSEMLAESDVASDLGGSSDEDIPIMVVSPETESAMSEKVHGLLNASPSYPPGSFSSDGNQYDYVLCSSSNLRAIVDGVAVNKRKLQDYLFFTL